MTSSLLIPLTDRSQIAAARRAVGRLTAELDFSESAAGRAALIATEAATNLVDYAREGMLLLRPCPSPCPSPCPNPCPAGSAAPSTSLSAFASASPQAALPAPADAASSSLNPATPSERQHAGVEMLFLDRGPGMATVACLRDGYSTGGSRGEGLGAIQRAADAFDLYSQSPEGSVLLAEVWGGRAATSGASSATSTAPPAFDVGVVCVPYPGEETCGDGWAVREDSEGLTVLAADGLGHGVLAAEAARAAQAAFRKVSSGASPAEFLSRIHQALRPTRGAAVAVARITSGEVVFAGLGNIAGVLLNRSRNQQMVSYSGIAGHTAERIRELRYAREPGARLVMYSDGLTSRWSSANYPGIEFRRSALLAGLLYRDHFRGRDDVTVLTIAERSADAIDPLRGSRVAEEPRS